jgi:hypothetical protein
MKIIFTLDPIKQVSPLNLQALARLEELVLDFTTVSKRCKKIVRGICFNYKYIMSVNEIFYTVSSKKISLTVI